MQIPKGRRTYRKIFKLFIAMYLEKVNIYDNDIAINIDKLTKGCLSINTLIKPNQFMYMKVHMGDTF